MFTTRRADGHLVSRPMATQERVSGSDLWFVADVSSHKLDELDNDAHVNLSYYNLKSREWVSVAGTAEVVTDRAKIHEMWNQVVEAWFPDGPDTPEVCLLRVDSESAEYWTSPGGTAATVLQWVKSKVTHSRMSVGESGKVEL